MRVKVGIVFTFELAAGSTIAVSMLRWLINAEIREHIEQHLPAGWLMKVHRIFLCAEGSADREIEVDYA